jgi:hypothetical protein
MPFDLNDYCDAVRSVLAEAESGERAIPLAPRGALEGVALTLLWSMSTDDLFKGEQVVSRNDAECVRSGLYLYLSALDESHTISQSISTDSGSFWHGIMHRQEPDYANAKYWFRRVRRHPVYDELERVTGEAWDPFAFVDRCEAAEQGGTENRDALVSLQRLEWQALFSHCYRLAVGR